MTKQNKDKKMENQPDDREVWDNLLDSPAGVDAFAELMKEAQKEVAQGASEEN